jgi:hypothetical protein
MLSALSALMISASRVAAPTPYSIRVGSSKLKVLRRFMGKYSFQTIFK